MVSAPAPPLIVSLPPPPESTLAALVPPMKSANAEPTTFSMPISLSVPSPVAEPVDSRTMTAFAASA